MDMLITYDVNTETKEGRRRLYRVAQVCKKYGQRVQLSVFECSVNEAKLEQLRSDLLRIINKEEDSLRIYRLFGSRQDCLESYGIDRYVDFSGPMVV
jgi:CRISPR-associated protein Cas2